MAVGESTKVGNADKSAKDTNVAPAAPREFWFDHLHDDLFASVVELPGSRKAPPATDPDPGSKPRNYTELLDDINDVLQVKAIGSAVLPRTAKAMPESVQAVPAEFSKEDLALLERQPVGV